VIDDMILQLLGSFGTVHKTDLVLFA